MTSMIELSGSYELTRFNALSHGILSRHVVLPWEDAGAYRALVAALVAEHAPQGPTEEHLVEELAGVIWRKQRLRRAEAAAHRSTLQLTMACYRDTADAALAHLGRSAQGENVRAAVAAPDADTSREMAEIDEVRLAADQALQRLRDDDPAAYDAALALLPETTRAWWAEQVTQEPSARSSETERHAATAASLRAFLQAEVIPWLTTRCRQLENRQLIREQALGKAADAAALEHLHRYEVHLDRKLERMLAMIYKLKQLRRPVPDEG
jgi:hypothetical protein